MPTRETLIRAWKSTGRWKYWALALAALLIAIGAGLLFDAPGIRQCAASANLDQCYLLGKTFWDWLGLIGVPLSLAILGFILQRQQQKRSEVLAREQREIAAEEEKEEILQTYFDRLSTLLIDKNLLAIAVKIYPPENEGTDTQPPQPDVTPEQRELFDAAVDVIRARTLSILRRFADDQDRKGNVIKFLTEAEVIGKAKINLSSANLSGAVLSSANLSSANLSSANLSDANLSFAVLIGANLSSANLSFAKLRRAVLSSANLSFAKLSFAKLRRAVLEGAVLEGAVLSSANLSFADLNTIRWDKATKWPTPEEVTKAQNIPEALKQQLGIE
jgi:hypothetical protein